MEEPATRSGSVSSNDERDNFPARGYERVSPSSWSRRTWRADMLARVDGGEMGLAAASSFQTLSMASGSRLALRHLGEAELAGRLGLLEGRRRG